MAGPDTFNYLFETPSLYVHQQLKPYIHLEAYKHFVDGWVSNVTVHHVISRQDTFIVTAHVRHSHRISETPVRAWVAVRRTNRSCFVCSLHMYGGVGGLLSCCIHPVYT